MRKFIKIENGEIIHAKNPMWIGNTMIANPTEKHLLQYGFKPILETERPEEKEGFVVVIKGYTETADGYEPIYVYEEISNDEVM